MASILCVCTYSCIDVYMHIHILKCNMQYCVWFYYTSICVFVGQYIHMHRHNYISTYIWYTCIFHVAHILSKQDNTHSSPSSYVWIMYFLKCQVSVRWFLSSLENWVLFSGLTRWKERRESSPLTSTFALWYTNTYHIHTHTHTQMTMKVTLKSCFMLCINTIFYH